MGRATGEELVAQSCALSVRELPPLQAGHRMLMSAINATFGAVGITSMRKDLRHIIRQGDEEAILVLVKVIL